MFVHCTVDFSIRAVSTENVRKCSCRLRAPEASVEKWSEDLVYGAGVLVLPANVFGHQQSVANNHFRVGLGRRDFPECMEAMKQHLLSTSVPA